MKKTEATLLLSQVSALDKSVLKWEKIVTNLTDKKQLSFTENGKYDCACCIEFREESCIKCPVKLQTGKAYCMGSPYDEWCEVLHTPKAISSCGIYKKNQFTADKKRAMTKAAIDELNFLKEIQYKKRAELSSEAEKLKLSIKKAKTALSSLLAIQDLIKEAL